MKNNIERRVWATDIEVRQAEEGESRVLEGYASIFNRDSEDFGGFVEQIKPGAFDGVLERSDVRALINHDSNQLLARSASGTLNLIVDDKGLKYSFEVPNTSYGNDLLEMVRRGDLTQSSFGFSLSSEGYEWEKREDGTRVRSITKIDKLFDVSPVTYPAYPDTEIAKRSFKKLIEEENNVPPVLRQGAELLLNINEKIL